MRGWVGPVAPVGPVGPVGPVAPVNPVAPVGPVHPTKSVKNNQNIENKGIEAHSRYTFFGTKAKKSYVFDEISTKLATFWELLHQTKTEHENK